jgi:hypothetical protein
MKLPKAIIGAIVGMSFVPGAWAAQDNATPLPAVTTPTPTEYYGTFEVTLDIAEKSAIASSTQVYCTVSLNVYAYEGAAGKIVSAEEGAATPTTFSGGKATCVVKVPYFWYLVAPASMVSMTVSAVAGSSTTVGSVVGRTSSRTIGAFPIPTPGATTTFAYSIYL